MELKEFTAILKKYWLVVIASTVLLGAAGIGFSPLTQQRSFETTATCMVQPLGILPGSASASDAMNRVMTTLGGIVSSDQMLQSVVGSLDGISDIDRLRKAIKTSVIPGSYLIEIRASDADADLAVRIAGAVAESFIAAVNEDSILGLEYRVALLYAPSQPEATGSNTYVRNSVLGGLLGLLVGIGLAGYLAYADSSIRSKADLLKLLGEPVLAEIPAVSRKNQSAEQDQGVGHEILEASRSLRASLMSIDAGAGLKAILVTSANAQEGRSFVSDQLARAYASTGKMTVLVDADLRKKALSTQGALVERPGLVNLIEGTADWREACWDTELDTLKLLPRGSIPPNPSEMLCSAGMREGLQQLREHFDIIVIDTSPMVEFSDTLTIAPAVDGVLIVAKAGSTDALSLKTTAEVLAKPGIRVLGLILNQVKPTKRTQRS